MKAMTPIPATVIAAVVSAIALAIAIAHATVRDHPAAGTIPAVAPIGSPHRTSRDTMQWFRWHPAAQPQQSRAAFGSTAVIGLESMTDLASLRAAYGLEQVHAIPALRAAHVHVDAAHLRALLRGAPADRRIRYVSPTGPRREVASMPDDPLVRSIDPSTSQPYEWQFTASHVDRALDYTAGNSSIVVGIIDSGVGCRSRSRRQGRRALERRPKGSGHPGRGHDRQRRHGPWHRGRITDRGQRPATASEWQASAAPRT